MQHRDICPSCEKEFPVPEDGGMWLTCPHCGARTPNPFAVDRRPKTGGHFSAIGVFGILLIIVACLGTMITACGGFYILPALGSAMPSVEIVLPFLGFLMAVLGGAMLIRFSYRTGLPARQWLG